MSYVNELKTRPIDEWAEFDQLIVDAAISQWRCHLNACVCVRSLSVLCNNLELLHLTRYCGHAN